MEYLIALIINSLYVVGIYQSFQDGMIFENLNPYPAFRLWKPEYKIANYLLKPVIGCVTCMASIHGLLFLYVFRNYLHLDIYIIIFYIFALAGMNRVLTVVADL